MSNKNNNESVLEFIALLSAEENGVLNSFLDYADPGRSSKIVPGVNVSKSISYVEQGILKELTTYPTWKDLTPKVQDAYLKALTVFKSELSK